MWGGMGGGGPGRENNAWMKIMGIVHTGPQRRQDQQHPGQAGSNEKALNA